MLSNQELHREYETGDVAVPQALCGGLHGCSCVAVVSDLISGHPLPRERWEQLESIQASLLYARQHLNGTVNALAVSGERDCRLCHLLSEKVREITESQPPKNYWLFIFRETHREFELQVAIEDVSNFLEHVSMHPPSRCVTLWAQSTASPSFDLLPAVEDSRKQSCLLRMPRSHSRLSDALEQVKNWRRQCDEQHPACTRTSSKLPLRVLDLSGIDSDAANVSLKISGLESKPYVALSYTWGQSTRLVTTKKHSALETCNMQYPADYSVELRRPFQNVGQDKPAFRCVSSASPAAIPLSMFPKTLKDAILIARSLGFRFIWIDSLCIIQGDKQDWADQGAAMTEIYGNASLVISATSTEHNEEDILRSVQIDKPGICSLRQSSVPGFLDIYAGGVPTIVDLEDKFLSSRGWVFQERLVSTATIHYTDEGLIWECASHTFVDAEQSVSAVRWKSEWRKVMSELPDDTADTGDAAKRRSIVSWYNWISAYSDRNLYDKRDKLPALAGVARRLAVKLRIPSDFYVAGLWKDDFRGGLLWRRHRLAKTLSRHCERYVAPSWSWASVTGRLEYRTVKWIGSNKNGTPLKVLNWDVIEDVPGTFGRVRYASIRVEGMLQKVTVDRMSHPGVRQGPHEECGISSGFINNQNILCTLDEFSEEDDQYLQCWCLWTGTHDFDGRDSDVFLLLRRKQSGDNVFWRIGFAEADGWWDRLSATPDSGRLTNPTLTGLVIE